ncbi:MAG: BlaI/MecI/CopY family transcriptional regulator [Rikenellaceae bacterium]
MEKLTAKEEEIMNHFWRLGPLFVRELLQEYDQPKPHFNTLSTVVRGLVEKGFLSYHAYGPTHQYYPLISAEQFKAQSLKGVLDRYYEKSIFSAVSALVDNNEITTDELKELLELIDRGEEKL